MKLLKGSDIMLAKLWASRIMHGKNTYDEVPRLLKPPVAEILEQLGVGYLVSEGG